MTLAIAVVGGGITGLTLALRLRARGADVTVFDAAPQFGGLSVAARFLEFTWDRFYHVISGGDRTLVGLVHELGLGSELCWQRATQGIWIDGTVRPLVSPLDLLALPGLSLRDKLRLGWLALRGHRPRPDAELDHTTAADWVRARCGETAFRRLWQPLLRSKLGDAADTTAARFLHATLRRLHAARGAGNRERFGYVRGGYRTILDRLVERLLAAGTALRPGSPVTSVRATGTGVAVTAGGVAHAFDRAVVTLPNPLLAGVVADLPAAAAAALLATTYLGAVVTVAVGKHPLSPHYILNLCDPGLAITGVIEMTALVDRQQTGGHALVYLPRYAVAGSALFAESDAALMERALADLGRIFPDSRSDWLVHCAVHRARLIQPIPIADEPAAAPPLVVVPGRVFCCNNAQLPGGALNNNDCIALAAAAAAVVAT